MIIFVYTYIIYIYVYCYIYIYTINIYIYYIGRLIFRLLIKTTDLASNHVTNLALSKENLLLWQAVKDPADPAASHARLLLNEGMKAAVTHGATKCMVDGHNAMMWFV
jgi:hypothetical protein